MAKKRNKIKSVPMNATLKVSVRENNQSNSLIDINKDVQEINLELLHSNPFQPRINIKLEPLNELIASIKQNGLLQPIVVTKQKDNKYIIVAGHRRFEAYKEIGRKSIKAVVKEDLSDKDLAILSLTENIMRENLHPIENAIAMKNMLDNKVIENQTKLAEYLGLSKGYISKLMGILKLPIRVIELIKEDGYTDINVLLLLNKLSSEKEIIKIYTKVKDLTRDEAKDYIKAILEKKKATKSEIIIIKNSKSKISVNVDIKKLSEPQIQMLNEKVELFNKEVLALTQGWNSK